MELKCQKITFLVHADKRLFLPMTTSHPIRSLAGILLPCLGVQLHYPSGPCRYYGPFTCLILFYTFIPSHYSLIFIYLFLDVICLYLDSFVYSPLHMFIILFYNPNFNVAQIHSLCKFNYNNINLNQTQIFDVHKWK